MSYFSIWELFVDKVEYRYEVGSGNEAVLGTHEKAVKALVYNPATCKHFI